MRKNSRLMTAPSSSAALPPPLPATTTWQRALWSRVAIFFAIFYGCLGAFLVLSDVLVSPLGCGPRAITDMQFLATDLKVYQMLNGRYPTTAQGLRALVERPTIEPWPKRWYQLMTEVPKDRWGHDYAYVGPGEKDLNGFDLRSLGEDGDKGTADDIVHEAWPRRTSAAR